MQSLINPTSRLSCQDNLLLEFLYFLSMNLSFKAQLVFCLCQLHHGNLSLIWIDVKEGVRFPSKPLYFQIRHCRKDTIRKRVELGSTNLAGLSDAAIIVQCKITTSFLGNSMFFLKQADYLFQLRISFQCWKGESYFSLFYIIHSCKRWKLMKRVPYCLTNKGGKLNAKLLISNPSPSPPKNVEFVCSVNLTKTWWLLSFNNIVRGGRGSSVKTQELVFLNIWI